MKVQLLLVLAFLLVPLHFTSAQTLYNGGFEDWEADSVAHWAFDNADDPTALLVQVNDPVFEGSSAAAVSWTSSAELTLTNTIDSRTWTSGSWFRFSASLVDYDNGRGFIKVLFTDEEGDTLATPGFVTSNTVSTEDSTWQHLTIHARVPENTNQAQAIIGFSGNYSDSLTTMYVDNASFLPVDPIQTTIADVQENNMVDSLVQIDGIVVISAGSVGGEYLPCFYMHDGESSGLRAKAEDLSWIEGIARGDSVSVTGTVTENGSITQVIGFFQEELGENLLLPEAAHYTSTALDTSTMVEGDWGYIEGTLLSIEGRSSFTLTIEDEEGEATAFYNAHSNTLIPSLGAIDPDAPIGWPVRIRGVVEAAPAGLQILTGGAEDAVYFIPQPHAFTNGGFESFDWFAGNAPPDHWTYDGQLWSIEQSDDEVHGGSYSAVVRWLNRATNLLWQDFALDESEECEVSCWFYDNNPNAQASIQLLFFDENGEQLGETLHGDSTADNNTWQQLILSDSIPADAYYARLQLAFFGNPGGQVTLYIDDASTSIEMDVKDGNEKERPQRFGLEELYPNPFNQSLRLQLVLPPEGKIQVEVFDILGRKVDLLHSGVMQAGEHELHWVPQNLTSGVYLVQARDHFGTSVVSKAVYMK